jgi:hypothetical protein
MTLTFRQLFVLLFISFAVFLAASVLQAWTGPTATAPNGNVAAPINVGTTDQVKDGGLSLDALAVFGSSYIQGKLGIGTAAPVVSIETPGTLKIGSGGEPCQSVTEGSLRYNSSSKTVEYCNGTVWGPLGSTGVSLDYTTTQESTGRIYGRSTNTTLDCPAGSVMTGIHGGGDSGGGGEIEWVYIRCTKLK